MIYGINTPALCHPDAQRILPELHDEFVELSVRSVRIPIQWNVLDPNGNGEFDSNVAARLDRAIATLPDGAQILGVVINVSPVLASQFFYDPGSISEPFAAFCERVARRFPAIREWEIWNEPNASDFYLSVKDGDKARPWTAAEFVEHLMLPGARAMKAVDPDLKLCIAAVAEDGICGHDDRPPALSNRLPRTPEFAPYRSDHPHGHFFFVPDFWNDFAKELARRRDEVMGLFDACGFHPYPYFRIHHREDKDLIRATKAHCETFLRHYDKAGLDGLEIWVSEFGARSLVIVGQHHDDPAAQADYLSEVLDYFAATGRFDRVYWYKQVDLLWDLKQEKTFGLFDHRFRPRPAFFVYRDAAMAGSAGEPVGEILETFRDAHRRQGSGFNPNIWTSRSTRIHGYSIPSPHETGGGEVLVYPGRNPGDLIRFDAQRPLVATGGRWVSSAWQFAMTHDSGPCELRFEFRQAGRSPLIVTLSLGGRCEISVEQGGQTLTTAVRKAQYSFADVQAVTGLKLDWGDGDLQFALDFGEICLHRSFSVAPPDPDIPVSVSFELIKSGGRPVFLRMTRISLKLQPVPNLMDRPPVNLNEEGRNWFVSLPRYSQIYQDDWVLQMLKFRRDGFFAEVGGHDGVANSNSVVLERLFGWTGMIVEANPRWHREICRNRTAIAFNNAAFSSTGQVLEFVDAGAVGGLIDQLQDDIHAGKRSEAISAGRVIQVTGRRVDDMLASAGAPDIVDYISVDTEGSEPEVLRSLDFGRFKVALITVEHGGVEPKREEVLSILEPHGFKRRRTWFEDWFWHPGVVAERLGMNADEVEEHVEQVFLTERTHRRIRLMQKARDLRDSGDFKASASVFEEAGKGFHTDNVHALIEAVVDRRKAGQAARAANIAEAALRQFPNNPRLLEAAALAFADASRKNSLKSALDAIRSHHPALLERPDLALIAN